MFPNRRGRMTVALCILIKRFPLVFAVAGILVLQAQPTDDRLTIVVPEGFATIEASGQSGALSNVMRLQEVYDASLLPSSSILISELRFRRDLVYGTTIVDGRATLRITLSTTAKAPDNLSATFVENTGSDATVVFDGEITMTSTNPGPPEGPNPFELGVRFQTPFGFDPSKGNLLLDIQTFSTSGITHNDASNRNDDQASRMFTYDPNATTAVFVDTGADVVEFFYVKSPWAQTLVVPNRFASQEDNGYSDTLGTPLRVQEVYGAGQFPSLPIFINELRFRRDAAAPPFTEGSANLRIVLSTTAKAPDGLSATFDENTGSDATIVFDGPAAFSSTGSGPSGGPNPFDLAVRLSTLFRYDPTRGNLLLDIRNFGASGMPKIDDASDDYGDQASWALAYDPNSANASYAVNTDADIVQLLYAGAGVWVSSWELGPYYNDFSGWLGMRLKVGTTPVTVTSLGRMVVPGNSRSHVVKLVNAGTGVDVAGGSVTVNMSGGTVRQFVYASLASPVTLPAGGEYYLASEEVSGGDAWHNIDGTVLTTTGVASVLGGGYKLPDGAWTTRAQPGGCLGACGAQVRVVCRGRGSRVGVDVR